MNSLAVSQEQNNKTDYLGRKGNMVYEARDNYLLDDHDDNTYIPYEPNKITFIQHPSTKEKLFVVKKPYISVCNVCSKNHKIFFYELQNGFCCYYCKNYKDGSWVFNKN